jgi:hypothetical protein
MKFNARLVLVAFVLAGCSEPVVSSVSGGKGGVAGAGGRGAGGAAGFGAGGTGGNRSTYADAGAPNQNPGPGPGDKNCGLQTFKLEQRPAELMLVLDRSGSMNDPAGPQSMTSKWADTTSALNETIMKTESLVHWGLKTFPSGDLRCNVADGVEVPSAPMNYATVWGHIMSAAPGTGAGGGTPTTLAIKKAVAQLNATPSMNPRYLVLATDGEPNCGMGGGGGGRQSGLNAPDDANAIAAVGEALTAGYKTFVIGIATGNEAENVLTKMAMAGGEPRMGTPPYYPVANRADLITALSVITGLVTDCVFRLNDVPPSPNDVAVNVGPTRVMRDPSHMNGWDYGAANRSIQFYGAACEDVKQSSGQNVQIIFGCPGVVIK